MGGCLPPKGLWKSSLSESMLLAWARVLDLLEQECGLAPADTYLGSSATSSCQGSSSAASSGSGAWSRACALLCDSCCLLPSRWLPNISLLSDPRFGSSRAASPCRSRPSCCEPLGASDRTGGFCAATARSDRGRLQPRQPLCILFLRADLAQEAQRHALAARGFGQHRVARHALCRGQARYAPTAGGLAIGAQPGSIRRTGCRSPSCLCWVSIIEISAEQPFPLHACRRGLRWLSSLDLWGRC